MNQQIGAETQKAVYCGHFREYDQDQLRTLFSKVAAVRAEDREFFNFTHHPITVYPAQGGTITEDRTVSERDVLEDLLIRRPTNYAVVIQGVVGTGKSELCAYLEHELEARDRHICRIQKDDDLMTILSERLPEFYRSNFGEPIPEADNLDQLRQDLERHPSTIASSATSSALLRLSRTRDLEYTSDQEDRIREHVQEKLGRLVDKETPGETADVITPEKYKSESYLHVFAEDVSAADAAAELSEAILSEVFNFYDTPPLKELLKTVGERFEDERPVMVFEDFSLPTKEAEKFRKYVERDNTDDNWDFVIAGIADATRPLRRRTSEDRWAFYWTSKTDSNHVPYLDAETAVDFIRPYLGYLKRHDGSVDYVRGESDGQFDSELVDPAPNSICERCGLCPDRFRDLFPFNRRFLYRVFVGLEESQQSPREYIDKIYDVLQEYACGDEKVLPSSTDALYGVSPESELIIDDAVVTDAKAYSDFAKWYGKVADGAVVVDARLARAFYLLSEDDEVDRAARDAGVTYNETDDVVCIPLATDTGSTSVVDDEQTSETTDQTTTEETGNMDDVTTQTRSAEAKASELINEHLNEVENWQQDPTSDRYSDVGYYVGVALENLVEYVTDDYTLFPGTNLRYNLSSERRPFIYPGGETTTDVDQIHVDPSAFELKQLRDLLRYGIRLDEGSPQAQQEDALEEIGVPLTYLGNRWRKKVRDRYLFGTNVLYNYQPPYDFDDFLLASYAWLVLFDDPWTELTAETINERFVRDESLSLDSELRSVLGEEFSTLDDLETAFSFADEIETLLQYRLGVTSSALDVPEVRRRLRRWQPYEVLASLGRGKCRNIHARVRMSPSLKLADYAEAFFDVQKEAEQFLTGAHDWQTAETLTTKLDGLSMDDFRDVVTDITSHDDVDPEFKESLRQFATLDQEDVDAVRGAAERCLMLDKSTNEMLFESKLVASKLDQHVVTSRLRKLHTEQRGGTTNFGERFEEVSSIYVE